MVENVYYKLVYYLSKCLFTTCQKYSMSKWREILSFILYYYVDDCIYQSLGLIWVWRSDCCNLIYKLDKLWCSVPGGIFWFQIRLTHNLSFLPSVAYDFYEIFILIHFLHVVCYFWYNALSLLRTVGYMTLRISMVV